VSGECARRLEQPAAAAYPRCFQTNSSGFLSGEFRKNSRSFPPRVSTNALVFFARCAGPRSTIRNIGCVAPTIRRLRNSMKSGCSCRSGLRLLGRPAFRLVCPRSGRQPPHRDKAQGDLEFVLNQFGDHLAGPQCESELHLQRSLLRHGVKDPPQRPVLVVNFIPLAQSRESGDALSWGIC
jgi:hypothetical protein